MLAGALDQPSAPELVAKRARARLLARRFSSGDVAVLSELLGAVGADVEIVPPFFCDDGVNTFIGSRVFLNTNCVILYCARVEIGDDVQVGPGSFTCTRPPTRSTPRLGAPGSRVRLR